MRCWIIVFFGLLPLIQSAANPFVLYEEKGKIGLKDEKGKIIIPAAFEALGWSDGNFSVVGEITGYKLKDRWGVINLQKQFITPADFESLTYPGGDRLIASKKINPFTIKFGCVDLSGKTTVPFRYDGIKVSGLRAVVFFKNGPGFEYGLIDLNDKGIIPPRYAQIYSIGTMRYAVEDSTTKTALFSEQGNQLTEFAIDSISAFRKGLAIVYQNFGQGVIDREGEIKIKPVHREIKIDDEGQVTFRDFDEWKILDGDNHERRKINADLLEEWGPGLFRITLAGKKGIVDNDLKMVTPIQFDFVGHDEFNLRVVGIGKQYGIIRKDNSYAIPINFDSLCLEKNFIRAGRHDNHKMAWSLYDTFGIEKTHSFYEFFGPFNGNFFSVKKRGYWGAVNRYGEEIINCVFDSLLQSKGNLIAVKFKGQFAIIDNLEKWMLPPQKNRIILVNENLFLERDENNIFLKNFNGETVYFTANPIAPRDGYLGETVTGGSEKHISYQGTEIVRDEAPVEVSSIQRTFAASEGMRGFQKDGKYGFLDARGRLRVANRYDDIGEFHDGLAPVKLIGRWGFVSMDDEIVVNPYYESVQPFVSGLSIVTRSGKFGLIGKTGNVALPIRYDSIDRLTDQSFLLKSGSLFGLADPAGNVLIETRFDHLQNLENGYVMVTRDGQSGLLTLHGLSTIPMVYDKLVYDRSRNQYLGWKKSSWHH